MYVASTYLGSFPVHLFRSWTHSQRTPGCETVLARGIERDGLVLEPNIVCMHTLAKNRRNASVVICDGASIPMCKFPRHQWGEEGCRRERARPRLSPKKRPSDIESRYIHLMVLLYPSPPPPCSLFLRVSRNKIFMSARFVECTRG